MNLDTKNENGVGTPNGLTAIRTISDLFGVDMYLIYDRRNLIGTTLSAYKVANGGLYFKVVGSTTNEEVGTPYHEDLSIMVDRLNRMRANIIISN